MELKDIGYDIINNRIRQVEVSFATYRVLVDSQWMNWMNILYTPAAQLPVKENQESKHLQHSNSTALFYEFVDLIIRLLTVIYDLYENNSCF